MQEALSSSSRVLSPQRAPISCSRPLTTSVCFVERFSFINISAYHRSCRLKDFNRLALSSTTTSGPRINIKKMGAVLGAQGNVGSGEAPVPPSGKPSNTWRSWVIAALLSIVLPFAHNRWGRLLAIKNEVETVVNGVEAVVETVEKVANEVAEIADEVEDRLPQGSKLKTLACIVENVAEETAKDAHIADQFIDKVEEMEKELESVFKGKVDEIVIEATEYEVIKDGNQIKKEQESVIVGGLHDTDLKVTRDEVTKDDNQCE